MSNVRLKKKSRHQIMASSDAAADTGPSHTGPEPAEPIAPIEPQEFEVQYYNGDILGRVAYSRGTTKRSGHII